MDENDVRLLRQGTPDMPVDLEVGVCSLCGSLVAAAGWLAHVASLHG